jgi:hypothetical protein
VHQLGARAKLLGNLERAGVGHDEAGVDRHVVERGGAADRGPLPHDVPVVADVHAGSVAADEREHEAAGVVERADPDPAGGEGSGRVVLPAGQAWTGAGPGARSTGAGAGEAAQPRLQVLRVQPAALGLPVAEPGPAEHLAEQPPLLLGRAPDGEHVHEQPARVKRRELGGRRCPRPVALDHPVGDRLRVHKGRGDCLVGGPRDGLDPGGFGRRGRHEVTLQVDLGAARRWEAGRTSQTAIWSDACQ